MCAFEPNWLPVMVGSIPLVEPAEAWDLVLEHLPEIPTWPQLPRRTYLENMYVQFSERFPGLVTEEERIFVDRHRDLDPELQDLYLAYLENELDYGAISPEHAAGLAALREGRVTFAEQPVALKGQVTGPVSWGLTVVDQDRRPVLYDEILGDAVGKHLRLKAAWQERELQKIHPQTILFVDEPYMASYGSAFVSLGREQVVALLEEVLAGISGLKGVHCCGNTDWSILLATSANILSLDAYEYAEALLLYPEEVSAFLDRGGMIAWGIVPAGPEAMSETVESLVGRLEGVLDQFVIKGVARERLTQSGLVSPSCGVGSLSIDVGRRAMELTVGVAEEMRRRYVEKAESTEGEKA